MSSRLTKRKISGPQRERAPLHTNSGSHSKVGHGAASHRCIRILRPWRRFHPGRALRKRYINAPLRITTPMPAPQSPMIISRRLPTTLSPASRAVIACCARRRRSSNVAEDSSLLRIASMGCGRTIRTRKTQKNSRATYRRLIVIKAAWCLRCILLGITSSSAESFLPSRGCSQGRLQVQKLHRRLTGGAETKDARISGPSSRASDFSRALPLPRPVFACLGAAGRLQDEESFARGKSSLPRKLSGQPAHESCALPRLERRGTAAGPNRSLKRRSFRSRLNTSI